MDDWCSKLLLHIHTGRPIPFISRSRIVIITSNESLLPKYSDWYLFETDVDCCSMWFPSRSDCPDLTEPTESDIDGNPYPVGGYFYPHLDESNCRYGRNYPQ